MKKSECFTGVSKHEKTMYENTSTYIVWVFLLIVFECLDIPVPVGHKLELFIMTSQMSRNQTMILHA